MLMDCPATSKAPPTWGGGTGQLHGHASSQRSQMRSSSEHVFEGSKVSTPLSYRHFRKSRCYQHPRLHRAELLKVLLAKPRLHRAEPLKVLKVMSTTVQIKGP